MNDEKGGTCLLVLLYVGTEPIHPLVEAFSGDRTTTLNVPAKAEAIQMIIFYLYSN